MNSDQLAIIRAILIKKGYKESAMTKNWLCTEDGSDRAADLRKEKPIIGILISGNIVSSGHGNLRVQDDIQEVEAIIKSKSPVTDLSATPKGDEKGSNPASGGINKAPELKKDDVMKGAIPSESKLGAGDASTKKGTTTALCQSCKCTMTGTIDIFQQIQDEYGVIYCQKCSEDADGKHDKKEEPPKASAKHEPKMSVKTCKLCGLELSGARALECYQKDKAFACEECEDKKNGGTKMETEIVDQNQNLSATKKKQEFVIGKCEAVAAQYGIPSEMANLFFMTMDGGLYIKNPGLLYLASKKGYSRIEVTTSFDEKAQEYSAECKIYPKWTKELFEGIAKLDKDLQKVAFDFATQPTNGTGRASKLSVKMTTMHPFLKEMAQTRAQNRALRAFTGYGATSAEELPEAQLERD